MKTVGAVDGRREIKKRETRAALQSAASRLFRENGFAGTTVQQIADAAAVSARTFFRYFESKEELLLPDLASLIGGVQHALGERPLDEAPLTSVCEAARTAFRDLYGGATAFVGAKFDFVSAPTPESIIRALMRWEDDLGAQLHARFVAAGADRHDDGVRLCSEVIARAGISAIRSAIRSSQLAPQDDPFRQMERFDARLSDAFMILKRGCVEPGRVYPLSR